MPKRKPLDLQILSETGVRLNIALPETLTFDESARSEVRASLKRRHAVPFAMRGPTVMRTLPLLLLFAANIALAQTASEPEAASEPKTLKERLGDKASDDQRVDNCKVPVNERGTKPRPDECPR
jgi:hypothetical protein